MSVMNTNPTNPQPSAVMPAVNQNMGLGTAFKLTHRGIESFLIGVTHGSDEDTIVQSCFHRIIPHCTALYTEVGTLTFIPVSHLVIPEGLHPYRHVKFRFSLDDAITLEAWHRKIPILSLDFENGLPEMDREKAKVLEQMKRADPFMEEQGMMNRLEKDGQYPDFIALHDHLKKGEIGLLEAFREQLTPEDRRLDTQREKRWSELLIPVLQNTIKPICIAIGVSHVVGQGGLLERFRNAGLQVEQILATSPADLTRFAPPSVREPRSYFPLPGYLPLLIEQAERVAKVQQSALPQQKASQTPPAAMAHRPAQKARSVEPTYMQLRPRPAEPVASTATRKTPGSTKRPGPPNGSSTTTKKSSGGVKYTKVIKQTGTTFLQTNRKIQ